MTFLEVMAKVPSHLYAALLGITALPVGVAVEYAKQFGALFMKGINATRELLVNILERSAASIPRLLLAYTLVIPLVLTAITAVFLIAASALIIAGVIDSLYVSLAGFCMGLYAGMGSVENLRDNHIIFFDLIQETIAPIQMPMIQLPANEIVFTRRFELQNDLELNERISRSVANYILNSRQRLINDIIDLRFDDPQPIPNNLVDIEVEHDADLGTEEAQIANNVLTVRELTQTEELLASFQTLNTPISFSTKNKLDAFKSKLNQYRTLANKLNEVQTALADNNLDAIEDQLIVLNEVKIPIIIAKQYNKDNQWITVPASSYVTCKEALLEWLRHNPTHPVTREEFGNPANYRCPDTNQAYPSKHVWHKLTANYCFTKELGEAADEIRVLMRDVTRLLQEAKAARSRLGSDHNALFANFPDIFNPYLPDEVPSSTFQFID